MIDWNDAAQVRAKLRELAPGKDERVTLVISSADTGEDRWNALVYSDDFKSPPTHLSAPTASELLGKVFARTVAPVAPDCTRLMVAGDIGLDEVAR